MSWFFLAIFCVLGWGCADLFYKKGSSEDDRYSHLKIAVWVGLVMGFCSLALLPFAESGADPSTIIKNAVRYSPASLCYIISMVIGYAGLRYLDLSIASPVQNASGGFSALCMILWYAIRGTVGTIFEKLTFLDLAGTALVVIGMIFMGIVEQKLSVSARKLNPEEKKYRFGALALLFPILYCLFDTLGTAADGIILDEEMGLGLGEIDVLVLYGLTFFLAGLGSWIFLLIKLKKPYNPFQRTEWPKAVAASCEEIGQVFYVYALAAHPVLAAPVVACYCIVSVILSHIFLKEKLKLAQYICIVVVILGILLLGISEGLAET